MHSPVPDALKTKCPLRKSILPNPKTKCRQDVDNMHQLWHSLHTCIGTYLIQGVMHH